MLINQIDLADFIYAFNPDTRVELIDHYDGERIFSGTAEEVLRMLDRSDNEYFIRFGSPINYAEIKSGKLIVYPDYQ